MALQISDTTPRVQYTATSGQTSFAVNFEFFDVADLKVYNGTTLLTYNNSPSSASQYSVTGAGVTGGGSITLGSPGATLNDSITIVRDLAIERLSDFPVSGNFPIQTLNTELDKIVAMLQQLEEQFARTLQYPVTTTTGFDVDLPELVANRVLSVNADATALLAEQELGTFKGDWAASTSYQVRDLVKDTSTGNIFFVNAAHTSSGSEPLTTNANSSKYDLIVDAAAATSSATNAANSATAAANSATAAATSASNAATSESNAATSESNASTSESNASTSATNASNSATAAATSASNAATSESNASTSETNAASSASAASSSATSASNSASTATTQASNASTSATNAATSETNAATSESNAATSESNAATSASNASTSETNASNSASAASTSATNAANSAAAAEATFDLFDDSYLGAKASNPTLDNDGNALQDGALYFDTTNNVMKVYDLATTTWLQLTPTASNQTNINTVAGISSDVSTVAGISSDVTTTAGISSNISTVAGISSNVTTVAGDTANIGTIATNLNGTDTIGTVAANISNVNAVGGISANVTTVAGISSDVTAVASDATDIGTVATNIANVNSVGGSIANVNTVASNISGVNSFAERYRVAASDPTTSLDAGDLVFNTGASALKYYDGSSWQQIVAGSLTDVVQDGTPELGGNLSTNGNNINFGDNDFVVMGSGGDLQIYHDGSNSYLQDVGTGNLIIRSNGAGVLFQKNPTENLAKFLTDGAVELYHDNSKKFETTSTGVDVTGTVNADGISVNDASPEGSGITINQGANDDIILSLKSSDIIHGVTTLAETDTFGLFKKASGDKGGLKIQGFTDSLGGDGGIELDGIINSDGSAYTSLIFNGALASGTGVTSLADTTKLIQFQNNGSQKFMVRGNGDTVISGDLDVTGTVTADGLSLGDSEKAQFGASNDLQIYHDGTASFIDEVGTGTLTIRADNYAQFRTPTNENMARFIVNGAVNLYYDNALKFETKTDGVNITGEVQADSLDIDGGGDITGTLTLHSNLDMQDDDKILLGTGDDLQIYHDGSNSYIIEQGTGNLRLKAENLLLTTPTDENYLVGTANGDVKLYYNGVQKIATTTGGISVTGAVVSDGLDMSDNDKILLGNSDDLQLYHDGSNSVIEDIGTGDLEIRSNGVGVLLQKGSTETLARFLTDGASELYHNNSKKLETTSSGATVTGTLSATAFSGDGSALTGISSGLSNKFHAWGVNSAGSAAGWRTINFATETVDDGNKFNHTSGTYTVPATGNYVLFAGHFHTNGVHNDYRIRFYSTTNGTLASSSAVDGDRVTTSGIMALTINEVIRVDVYHGNGAHADAGGRGSFFGGFRLI